MNRYITFFLSALLLSLRSFAQVDSTIGLSAPGSATGDYGDLAHYLCDGLHGDREKVNAIYNWVTHNIRYDVKAIKKGHLETPKVQKVLKNRRALCGGYAELFTAMCREAGLKAVSIDGYAKDWVFDNGDKMYVPRHEWCAVQVDGKWELADPTWGAGVLVQAPTTLRKVLNKITRKKITYAKRTKFQFRYDTAWFLPDPAVFKLKHLPTDPVWQLGDSTMPLQVFEAGDSAVRLFDGQYCHDRQVNPDLDRISKLTEEEQQFEMADRAYQFNKRYSVALAIKYSNRAASTLEKAFTDSTVHDGKLLVSDASNSLKRSEEYIKDQKKVFPDEYNTLKKKNKTKNQEAKKDIREIKTDDKRLAAQDKKYANAVGSKGGKLKKKAGIVSKKRYDADPKKIDDVETGKAEKKDDAPELVILRDSIASRKAMIASLQSKVDSEEVRIKTVETANNTRLDSLGYYLSTADSILVLETRSRLSLHDNYDDEVIQYGNSFKTFKYHKADTLQKYYALYFDTVTAIQDDRQKLQIAQMDVYRKILKSMVQYRKWNSDPAIKKDYKETVSAFRDCIAAYSDADVSYLGYLKANKKLFQGLSKVSKKELKLAGYMEKAEDLRKALEQGALNKKQSVDLNENKKQLADVARLRKKVDQLVDKLD
jgi:Transglutaminase-like superfamily